MKGYLQTFSFCLKAYQKWNVLAHFWKKVPLMPVRKGDGKGRSEETDQIKIKLRREAPLDKRQSLKEETDEIKNEIQMGAQQWWNCGKEIAEVKLVLMPTFRDKFWSPVQRAVLVRLHNFQFLSNAHVASPCGISVGGRFPQHSPLDFKRDVLTF